MRGWAGLAAVLLLGCVRGDDESPEGVARRFVEASARGDARAVLDLLDGATRADLARLAGRGSEQAGAGVRLRPDEALATGLRAHAPAPAIDVIERGGERCRVRLSSGGQAEELELRREQGRWRVRLPTRR